MRTKILKILGLFFVLLFFIQFSFAQTMGDVYKTIKIGGALELLFGLRPDQPIEVGIIWLIIFIMLFFAFSDIFKLFTVFSPKTAYILGFGLAMITAMVRGVLWLSVRIFSWIGGFGAISIALVMISAFLVFIIVHWLTGGRFYNWAARRQAQLQGIKAAMPIIKGAQMLGQVGQAAGQKPGKGP